jgi:hypothetical protein
MTAAGQNRRSIAAALPDTVLGARSLLNPPR